MSSNAWLHHQDLDCIASDASKGIFAVGGIRVPFWCFVGSSVHPSVFGGGSFDDRPDSITVHSSSSHLCLHCLCYWGYPLQCQGWCYSAHCCYCCSNCCYCCYCYCCYPRWCWRTLHLRHHLHPHRSPSCCCYYCCWSCCWCCWCCCCCSLWGWCLWSDYYCRVRCYVVGGDDGDCGCDGGGYSGCFPSARARVHVVVFHLRNVLCVAGPRGNPQPTRSHFLYHCY